jgi:hypothetical protein
MAAHERSSSSRLLAVLRIMSKRFKAICVWFDSPGSMLGCVGAGIVMEERKSRKGFKERLNVVSIWSNKREFYVLGIK